MTTPTPTSNPLPAGITAGAPESLIDVAQLTQLANAFFSALPGTSNAPSAPPVLPTAATPTENVSQPKIVPNAITPTGVPDVASGVPATSGRPGGVALGVPEAYAAALPNSGIEPAFPSVPAGAPAPSTPYYFLGEGSVAPSAMPASNNVSNEDRVIAQPFALPGVGDLRAVLDGIGFTEYNNEHGKTPASANTTPFYFLDSNNVPSVATSGVAPFDVHAVRRDFPILSERLKNGKQLVWLDNAATTHKPQAVIDRLAYFYQHENSNIHRAAHELAARATDAYEAARNKVAKFIGASSPQEIIFVRGATEAINLVAQSWGRANIQAGDEIIVSHLEHHANIVPWQQLVAEKGAKLRVIPVDDSGQVLLDEYKKLLNDKTKLVSVTQVSNALGTVVPIKEIVELAHRAGACALVDGAQSVPHLRVNVQQLDADFFIFSGHKIFGPTGIGVVYGKQSVLENMPPWQGGGNMIQDVTFEKTIYQEPPARFEAGTGNIADAVGLGAALDYLERIGFENAARYEHGLLEYATHHLKTVPGLRLIGTAADKASVLSFVLDAYTTEEVGKALNEEGIAVRSGHHCAQPILRRFGLEATVRPSLAFYNTCEEIDALVNVVRRLSAYRRK